ncbi:MAG: hypothetical protein KF816_08660 [Melioribacteraceae bacterium]|nr:MAG: hypothetical protein FD143_60 [Ignavibacteria bacterium]KAF0162525.1 MAG: hypothetical protein FD188_128 [Ignavibacteria bacterium]MBX3008083.1 hypothetical protein [Melioribacteraceae bacterium]
MKIIFSLVFLFIAGCAATIIYRSKGEELYYNKCGGCHRIHSKTEFTSEKWKSEVEEMSKKARLNEDEKRMIIEYLTNDSLHVAKP